MEKKYGYWGKILVVDLTTKEIKNETVPDEVYHNLVGGLGLGAWYLYKNLPANADPIGPESIFGMVTGMLTNCSVFYTGRFTTIFKSPSTEGFGDANCGGYFAPALKKTGYDGIFFHGVSETPVYLYMDDKNTELRDASHVWGLDICETEEILEKECYVNKRPRVATIGPAGEKLSFISGVCHDRGRIAARGGGGAVMGSKKLKAVVLCTNKRIPVYDLPTIKEYNKKHWFEGIKPSNMPEGMKNSSMYFSGLKAAKAMLEGTDKVPGEVDSIHSLPPMFKKWGTCATSVSSAVNGDSQIRNYAGDPSEFTEEQVLTLDADKIIAIEDRKYHCHSCAIGCGGVLDIKSLRDGRFEEAHKPEYESVSVFGTMLEVWDRDAMIYATEICNRGGMDSISAGATIAFAMELYEKGILTKEDCDGLELKWGNGDVVCALLDKMVNREPGIGALLADGVRIAAERIGGDASKYAVHTGGMEPGQHDARKSPGRASAYVMDAAPGRHTSAIMSSYRMYKSFKFIDWLPAPEPGAASEDYMPNKRSVIMNAVALWEGRLIDIAGACNIGALVGFDTWPIYSYLNAATGWDRPAEEYLMCAKAVFTLRHLFNMKHGIDMAKVYIHPRVYSGLTKGPLRYKYVPYDGFRALEWEFMGYDPETGIPGEECIRSLGLDKIVNIKEAIPTWQE